MKKFFNSVLAAALALTLVAGPAFAKGEAEFTDIAGAYGEDSILVLHALGVVNGYEDGDFHPEDTVTRAQFAVMLTRALGYEKLAESMVSLNNFPDVATGYDWAKGAINLAAARGWITGYPDGNFGPADTISQEQMATILVRALGIKTEASEPWYIGPVLAAADAGITDEFFTIGADATRGQVAVAIRNFLGAEVNAAGTYDLEKGKARVETVTGDLYSKSGDRITIEYKDDEDKDVQATYNLKDLPVYGSLTPGAKVDVIVKDGKPVMARVVNIVKTLAVLDVKADFVIVSEDGEEVTYYFDDADLADEVDPGHYYDFVFNTAGDIVAVKENSSAGSGVITTWRKVSGEDKVTVGGKEYGIADTATFTHVIYVNGKTAVAKTTGNDWDDMKDLINKGDKMLNIVLEDGKIKTADVFGSKTKATVTKADKNDVTLEFDSGATLDIDIRSKDFRNIKITKGDDELAWADVKKDQVVDVTVKPDSDPAKSKMESIALSKAADIEKAIISNVEVDADDNVTITIDGTDYAIADDADVTGSLTDATKIDLYDYVEEATIKGGKISAIKIYRSKTTGTAGNLEAKLNADGDIVRTFEVGGVAEELTSDAVIAKKNGSTVKFSEIDGKSVTIYRNPKGKVYRVTVN